MRCIRGRLKLLSRLELISWKKDAPLGLEKTPARGSGAVSALYYARLTVQIPLEGSYPLKVSMAPRLWEIWSNAPRARNYGLWGTILLFGFGTAGGRITSLFYFCSRFFMFLLFRVQFSLASMMRKKAGRFQQLS